MSSFKDVQELYAAVQKYMDRNDKSVVDKIPMWVNMAEQELDRRLRHPAAMVRALITIPANTGQIKAPANLSELVHARVQGQEQPMYRRSLEMLYAPPEPLGIYPTAIASMQNTYQFNKLCHEDFQLEFIYYVAPNKLSLENVTNLYLVALGDFLLYVALSNGFSYDTNLEESAYYRSMAEKALADLQEQIEREAISGSTMVSLSDSRHLVRYF